MELTEHRNRYFQAMRQHASAYAMSVKLFEEDVSEAKADKSYKDNLSQYGLYTKLISQLIAKSWLDTDEGKKIKQTLLYGTEEDIKQLMRENGVDWDDLYAPLTVKPRVDWNTFWGNFQEVAGPDEPLVINVPYPPRPAEVTDQQLTDWINDKSDRVYPPTAYIPLTCC